MKLPALIVAAAMAAPVLAFELVVKIAPWMFPRDLTAIACKNRIDPGEFWITDKELGYAVNQKFSHECDWPGFRLRARNAPFPGQNLYGYRVDSRGPVQGRADILALGDSYTYAVEVDEDSTWVSLLGKMSGLRTVNLGAAGYGTTQEAALYRRYGSLLHPRLVLLLLVVNDASDNEDIASWQSDRAAGRVSGWMARLLPYKFCKSLGASPGVCRAVKAASALGLAANVVITRTFTYWLGTRVFDPSRSQAGMRMLLRDLGSIKGLAAGQGASFAVVIHESWKRRYPESLKEVAGFLGKEGIPYLDLSRAVGRTYHGVRTKILLDGHWNETGHAMAAHEIHRFLLARKLIKARAARRASAGSR